MAWINNDELGAETITAIVNSLIDDKTLWKADSQSSSRYFLIPLPSFSISVSSIPVLLLSPFSGSPVKRICRRSQEYNETWLVEKKHPSDHDVVVKVHVPFVDEQDGRTRGVTLAFSRTTEVRGCV